MTLAISSSSPVVSVAVFEDAGEVLGEASRMAKGSASEAVSELISEILTAVGRQCSDLSRIAVDVGPGGFTSVRVGVTFAKTLAWSLGVPIVSVTSFDLIDSKRAVAVPSKKGEWYFRTPELEPKIVTEFDSYQTVGYGQGFEQESWPTALRVADLEDRLQESNALSLLPYYLAEPSISRPKNPTVLPGVHP